ncbi:MAG: hypothetical protein AAF730_05220 [Bacteroidota bacterium]
MRIRAWFLPLLLIGALSACSSSNVVTTQAPQLAEAGPSFASDIQPLLQNKFGFLASLEPGLRFNSYETLLQGSDNGQVLIPFDADRSPLVQYAEKENSGVSAAEVQVLRSWIDAGARGDDGAVPFADATNLLYVCNQYEAAISVIHMDRNQVIRTVYLSEFGYDKNASPHHTAVSSDGAHWYVSLIGASKVLKFNRQNELVGTADFETPGMLAMAPGDETLYVARSMMAVNPPQRIGMIEVDGMKAEELDVFFARPHALAMQPDGEVVYTASLAENRIAALRPAEEEIELVSVDGPTQTFVQFAVSPDGSRMMAGGEISGQVIFFDTSTPDQPKEIKRVDVGSRPWHPVYSPDGKYVYFGNQGENTVTVMDAEAMTIHKVIENDGFAEPHGIAIRPDGRYLYVANRNLKGTYEPRINRTAMATKTMDHSTMDHSTMDHSNMDHSQMDHGDKENEGMDHSTMDHGGMDHGGMKMERSGLGGTIVVIDTQTMDVARVLEVGEYPSGMSRAAWR